MKHLHSNITTSLARFESDARSDERVSILILLLAVGGFFWPALTTPGVLIWPHSGLGSDITYRHWPDLIRYAQSWAIGKVAVWDSSVALGRPLAGDPTVLFLYPFDILFAWVSPEFAFNALDALHVFLAGLFMFWLLRLGYHLSRPAALIGALTFAFAPKFISHLAGGHVGLVWGLTWAPAVLLGLQLAIDGWVLGAALGGLALALQMPTHLQIPYYTALICSAYWFWHLVPSLWSAMRCNGDGWKRVRQLMAAYTVWLASFVLIAAAVLLPLLELLPFNSRGDFTLADANLYALPPLLLVTLLVPSNFQFPEWTMFIGFVPLVLAGLGWFGNRRREWLFFALFIVFALLYAIGASTPLFELALNIIPGFKMLRVPTRLWFFGGLAVAVLAGFGAEVLVSNEARLALRAKLRWIGLAAVAYLIGGLVAWLVYRIMLQRWHEPTLHRLVIAGAMAILGGMWLSDRLNGYKFQWLLIPLVLFDLLPVDIAQIDLINPRSEFLRSTPALDFVANQPGVFRVYSPAGDLPYALAAERRVETLEGLLAFQIGHSGNMIRKATGCATLNYATAIPPCLTEKVRTSRPDAAMLGELNVRYVISHESIVDPNFSLVILGDPKVYENRLWQERVRLLGPGSVSVTYQNDGKYEIRVSAVASDTLVIAETWLPGWRTVVDGQPQPVTKVNEALMGVQISPGDHILQVKYEPLGWGIGWRITLISLILLTGWCILAAWRRAR